MKKGIEFKKVDFLLVGVLIAFFLTSCKKESSIQPENKAINSNYFPLETGRYWIYQIDSLYYNDFTSKIDTFNFQLKELIESDYIDEAGITAYRIERYYRENAQDNWQLKRIWHASKKNIFAFKTEENIKYVKMIFPVKSGTTWNGNSYNGLGEQTYKYLDVNKNATILNLSFDSVSTILHKADTSLISFENEFEQYAANVGLIKFRKASLKDTRSTIQTSIPIYDRANTGYDVIYSLISYGK